MAENCLLVNLKKELFIIINRTGILSHESPVTLPKQANEYAVHQQTPFTGARCQEVGWSPTSAQKGAGVKGRRECRPSSRGADHVALQEAAALAVGRQQATDFESKEGRRQKQQAQCRAGPGAPGE